MAEPVSRAAWSRLVALLNAYVSEGSNAFSHSGPSWKAEYWSTENSGLDISEDWSFPDRISRGMVKSMFEWSTQVDDMYRATCGAMVWAGERVANAPFLVKQVAVPGVVIGEEVLKLKSALDRGPEHGYSVFATSPLQGLGPVLGTALMNLVSVDQHRAPTVDQYVIDWMWQYGQVSPDWTLDLHAFTQEQYDRYVAWSRLALDRFRESGHLPDHCDDHAFIGYLMSTDRLHSLLGIRFSGWVQTVDSFTSGAAKK
jgi:hypothetical protein